MTTQQPTVRIADLTLTCRAQDLERFVALGLGLLRIRGAVADLEIARTDQDFFSHRCHLAAAGIPFYGYAATSRDLVAVVFAADGHQHFEAPAGAGRHPAAQLLSGSGLPYGAELYLGRHYYRCLASTLDNLPDREPWLPAMPKEQADAMACECGGRGWFLAEDEDTGRTIRRWSQSELAEAAEDEGVGLVEGGEREAQGADQLLERLRLRVDLATLVVGDGAIEPTPGRRSADHPQGTQDLVPPPPA
jgi:hypothetical protein